MNRIARLLVIVAVIALVRCGGGGGDSGSVSPPVSGRTYGGAGGDYAWSVQQTSGGGYVFAGFTNSSGAGGFDAWVVETDAAGNAVRERTFGGAGDDYAFCIQQTSDGGYIVAGVDNEITGRLPTPGMWLPLDFSGALTLRKLSAGLTLEWEQTFGRFSVWRNGCEEYYLFSVGCAVQQTSDGGYVVGGATGNWWGGGETLLLKTDAAGREQWHVFLDGEIGTGVRQAADNGYVVAADNAGLIKTAPDGTLEWTRPLGGSAHAVWNARDGGFVAAGDIPGNAGDVFVAKRTSAGDNVWERAIGSPGGDIGFAIQQATDNGFIVAGAGTLAGAANGLFGVLLVKFDAAGALAWERCFGGTADDVGRSIRETLDGGYIVAGSTASKGAGGVDAYLVKTDAAGVPQW